MSLFNEDQEAYMDSLSRMADEVRCYCGWYRFGECYNCNRSEDGFRWKLDRPHSMGARIGWYQEGICYPTGYEHYLKTR